MTFAALFSINKLPILQAFLSCLAHQNELEKHHLLNFTI
jgi:hypothetical protein